jgi:mono/diheme cytochrome c family protein
VAAVVAAVVAAIQLVPYGRDHTNPVVAMEPTWDSAETRALASRACFDCHSNETTWPWYSSIAPVSWLVQHDVDEGRGVVNFSEWDRMQEEAADSGETVREGEMPMAIYTWLHPAARLDPRERERLARGLERTMGDEQARLEVGGR